jgi:hypothetical protein
MQPAPLHPGGAQRPVRLIIVDSISSPFRETDATQRGGLADRTGMLSRMGKGLSLAYNRPRYKPQLSCFYLLLPQLE